MNIDFYLPERSQYNVLHHFTRKLYEAFVQKGYACRLLENHEILQEVRKNPGDLSISFNGAPQITPGVFLCDIVERPHITWLVDLPIHYLGLVESPWISIACDDEYSCQWLEQMGFSNCFFLPQAVETDVFCDPAKERQYDVVFFASYFDYQEKLNTLPQELAALFEEAAEKALVDVDTPFLEQLFDLYRQHPDVHEHDPFP